MSVHFILFLPCDKRIELGANPDRPLDRVCGQWTIDIVTEQNNAHAFNKVNLITMNLTKKLTLHVKIDILMWFTILPLPNVA